MILFPNCKINLGLNIIRKRADGFHDLETIFYPIPINDILEVVPASRFAFIPSGIDIPGDENSNLCVKAYQLIKKEFHSLPEIEIYLYKHIPIGAGLGGGSSDGAFMIRILNEMFDLQFSGDQLNHFARKMGSDCSFFLLNKPCFATGRGELLQPIDLDLSSYSFVLVHTGIHIETAWAYSQLIPSPPSRSGKEIIQEPVICWKKKLVNDFETPVFTKFPILEKIKKTLYNAGSLYVSLTGSGSSIYGIFEKDAVPSLSFDPNFQTVIIK